MAPTLLIRVRLVATAIITVADIGTDGLVVYRFLQDGRWDYAAVAASILAFLPLLRFTRAYVYKRNVRVACSHALMLDLVRAGWAGFQETSSERIQQFAEHVQRVKLMEMVFEALPEALFAAYVLLSRVLAVECTTGDEPKCFTGTVSNNIELAVSVSMSVCSVSLGVGLERINTVKALAYRVATLLWTLAEVSVRVGAASIFMVGYQAWYFVALFVRFLGAVAIQFTNARNRTEQRTLDTVLMAFQQTFLTHGQTRNPQDHFAFGLHVVSDGLHIVLPVVNRLVTWLQPVSGQGMTPGAVASGVCLSEVWGTDACLEDEHSHEGRAQTKMYPLALVVTTGLLLVVNLVLYAVSYQGRPRDHLRTTILAPMAGSGVNPLSPRLFRAKTLAELPEGGQGATTTSARMTQHKRFHF